MAEKIDLGTYTFDTSEMIRATSELKKKLDDLKKAQSELKDTSSPDYVKNAADIKALNKEYNTNINLLAKNTKATADQAARTELLDAALSAEATTIEELRDQNKALNQLRNTANLKTEEGRKQLEQLNAKLDENNATIKENVDQYTQQKINVGNYTDSIKEAFNGQELLNTAMKDSSSVLPALGSGMKSATSATLGLVKASLSFLATPLGVFVGALAAAFGLVSNAMSRSEETTNKLSAVFGKFTGIIKGVLGALEPLGEFLVDTLVSALESVEKGLKSTISGLSSALRSLGLESAAKSVDSFSDSLERAAKSGQELTKAELELTKARREARLVQLQFQKDAEVLRQIRDDESKTVAERIKANEDLGKILEEQLATELAIAQKALDVANLRIEQDGRTEEALNAQAEALTEIADIEERITGQRSEQLANLNGLRREAIDLQKEQLNLALEVSRKELDLFLQTQGVKKQSLEEEIALAEQVAERKKEIAQKEFEASEKTEADKLQLAINTNEAEKELLQVRTDAAIQNAERELEIFRTTLESKRNENAIFTDEYLIQEKLKNDALLAQEQEFAKVRLEQGLINQQEYQDRLRELELENRIANEEADAEVAEAKREQELERKIAEFELEQERLEEQGATAFELEQARQDFQYEESQRKLNESLAAQKISQENFNAQKLLLDKQYAQASEQIERAKTDAKLAMANDALGNIATLLGEETAAGKAAAIAQATINAYQGLTAVLAAPSLIPEPLGSIAKGISAAAILASGLANVKKITQTKAPKMAQGGIMQIKGKSHAAGGEPIFVGNQYVGEAEGDEGIGILNKRAFASFLNYNNKFANGGIISPSSIGSIQDKVREDFDSSQMVTMMAEAVREGSREGSAVGSATGSQEGISELSENRRIQANATF